MADQRRGRGDSWQPYEEPPRRPSAQPSRNGDPRSIISDAHARALAECWQDAARPEHPVTILARSGEITSDAERMIAHDLQLLEMASAAWGNPPSIPEKQLQALLAYVRHCGLRPEVQGWRYLRDSEFIRSIRKMASEVRSTAAYEPIPEVELPRERRGINGDYLGDNR